MKNYLIKSLSKIKSTNWHWTDRACEGDIYPYYQKMHRISEASFRKFLQGNWEYLYFENEVDEVNQVFKDQFYKFYDIWKQEPCNILYCGPDTQMLRPTEIFGRFDKFMMFNYTEPRSNGLFTHYLNADIRYMPLTMKQETWDIGIKKFCTLNYWGYDQNVYNEMIWSQGLTPEQAICPELAYQGFGIHGDKSYANKWNNCDLNDAHIVHWHGSRSAAIRLMIMEEFAQQTGVEYNYDNLN